MYLQLIKCLILYFLGVMPTSLPVSACVQVPKFGLETIGKSASMPEQGQLQQHLKQDVEKITSSVSTLRINQKHQDNKVC